MKNRRNKIYIFLTALLVCTILCSCSTDELFDMSEYSRIRSENSEDQENKYSSFMVTEESRKEVSRIEASKREASMREESRKEASRKASELEISRQESLKRLEEEKTEEQHLRDYIEGMATSGEGTIKSTKKPYYWKQNKFSIDDFNNDKSPELVVQYYVSKTKDYAEYGVALEIIKFRKGQFYSYVRTNDMSDYVSTDVVSSLKHVVCDELYVDEENNLAIMATSLYNSSPIAAVYDAYILHTDKVSHEESLYVSVEEYKGKSNVFEPNRCGFGIDGKDLLIFHFFTNPKNRIKYEQEVGAAHHRQVLDIRRYNMFTVSDSAVHLLEQSNHYDSRKVRFVPLDEIEKAYQQQAGSTTVS